MTKEEAIETIKTAIARIEWEYPMDYAVAFDMAIEALSQPEIVRCKDCKYRGSKICPFYQKYKGEKYDDWFCADGEKAVKLE